MKYIILYLTLLFSAKLWAEFDDVNVRQTAASKHGANCFFSLKNYSNTQVTLIEQASNTPSSYSVSFEKLIDGNKVVSLQDALDVEKKKVGPQDDSTSKSALKNYEFISLYPVSGDIGLTCDDVVDGNLVIKINNRNFIFPTGKISSSLKPTDFQFNYLFYQKSEQAELDKRLARIPEFRKLIDELRECTKKKDEACFKKYLYLPSDGNGNEQMLYKSFTDVLLRGHILSSPKAYAYYVKTRSKEDAEEDNSIPPGIESMIDKEKTGVWNWLSSALSLKLDGEYYINLSSGKINEPINDVYVHLEKTSITLAFKRDKSKWYLDNITLTTENEGLSY
jgi:hypothetical protein